ncbi:hypothetical protein [Bdellovibrio sp. HCB209]|uniref:hypothetical protein n=1 Tax=Bdellovibrio sp. HCB209 TaxID=3394354 RepID=UPI0039B66A6C
MKLTALVITSLLILTSCQTFQDSLNLEKIQPFTSDGCSMSPNGPRAKPNGFLECCVNHDLAYWQGGTLEQKQTADLALQACITENSNEKIGKVFYEAVSLGGGPQFNTSFRWGYGWPKRRTYEALNHTERKSVEQELQNIRWHEIYTSLKSE